MTDQSRCEVWRDDPPDARTAEIVASLAARIELRTEEVGRQLAERYRREILEYRTVGEPAFETDIQAMATRNLEALLARLRAGAPVTEEALDRFRRSATRRAHQGVSIHAVLHAYRLWGQAAWEEILAAIDTDNPEECQAALWVAGQVMAHVDTVSTAVAAAYLDEIAGVWSDREVVRRDLLERLIVGQVGSDLAHRQARALRLDLATSHLVIVARARAEAGAERVAMRTALEGAKSHLRPSCGSLLVGLRQSEVVAIWPLTGPAQEPQAHQQANELAAELPDFLVGIGRLHLGIEGIAASYGEAGEALAIARTNAVSGRAVAFADVLLDHIVRSGSHATTLGEEVVAPIRAYDENRQASLLPTLRAYVENGFNLTHGATALDVHPNTVVYRLRRIKELTGRDPNDPNDLLVLALGLKVADMGGPNQGP